MENQSINNLNINNENSSSAVNLLKNFSNQKATTNNSSDLNKLKKNNQSKNKNKNKLNNLKFKCKYCSHLFKSELALLSHLKVHFKAAKEPQKLSKNESSEFIVIENYIIKSEIDLHYIGNKYFDVYLKSKKCNVFNPNKYKNSSFLCPFPNCNSSFKSKFCHFVNHLKSKHWCDNRIVQIFGAESINKSKNKVERQQLVRKKGKTNRIEKHNLPIPANQIQPLKEYESPSIQNIEFVKDNNSDKLEGEVSFGNLIDFFNGFFGQSTVFNVLMNGDLKFVIKFNNLYFLVNNDGSM